MVMRSLFHQETTIKGGTEEFVRDAVQKVLGDGVKLPATRRLEVYSIVPLDTNLDTGALFQPDTSFITYLLDVGWPAMPGLYSVATDSTENQVFSVASTDEQRIIYPDSVGILLIGQKQGLSEDQIRTALKPFIESVVSYTPYLVEVAVKPFHERAMAQVIEKELPDVVRYAETSWIQRIVYSPGWFARKLL